MRRWILFAVLVILASVPWIGLADPPASADPPITVKLGPLPDLKLQPRPPISAAQAKHIKQLIASLAKLDKPDFGLSATLSGSDFLPLPGQEQVATMVLTDHGLATNSPLKELIALGPDALPFLLDALDDQTPTKLVIGHTGGLGAMWFSNELWLNPVNPSEQAVFRQRGAKPPKETDVHSYTVKIGDVCFAAVGQIVGREYSAVRYQPTACIVINSTAHDPAFCAEIRSIWKSNDPRQKLFDSLCADYATQGIFNGTSLDGWDEGNNFECGAAMRLLFYFPKESTAMLADRLNALNVAEDRSDDD
ncbi:MAG TPA: hypothetical protein VHY37_01820, partial [Tepidisphaeraceae bacterium]|nr:hypothetical protein [Tepidisphaeraceae bacterium]